MNTSAWKCSISIHNTNYPYNTNKYNVMLFPFPGTVITRRVVRALHTREGSGRLLLHVHLEDGLQLGHDRPHGVPWIHHVFSLVPVQDVGGAALLPEVLGHKGHNHERQLQTLLPGGADAHHTDGTPADNTVHQIEQSPDASVGVVCQTVHVTQLEKHIVPCSF